jgi:hypothetical protein
MYANTKTINVGAKLAYIYLIISCIVCYEENVTSNLARRRCYEKGLGGGQKAWK